jgi:hypothetical protein
LQSAMMPSQSIEPGLPRASFSSGSSPRMTDVG